MAIGFRTSGMFGPRKQEKPQAMPSAMPIGIKEMTAKPKFFGQGGAGRAIAGTIGDFLLQQSGMDPIYLPNVLQQRDAEERARMAQQQRMQKREDMQWEWQNKPKDARYNDTIEDFRWYQGLSDADRKLYHQMKPTIAFRADGTPVAVNPYDLSSAQTPVFAGWPDEEGGQSAPPTGNFR